MHVQVPSLFWHIKYITSNTTCLVKYPNMAHQDFSLNGNGYEEPWVCHLESVAKCPGLNFQPNRAGLLYIFCIQQPTTTQPDRPACCQPRILNPHWIFSPILLVYFTFGPTTFGPSQPSLGGSKNNFTIFLFFHFHIVQQLGNFALIEDSAVKVKTMTNRNIIISQNQNRKMKNMFEK